MVPVGWQEMQCPRTYVKEFRKVAKVSPDSSADDKTKANSADVNQEINK